MHFFQLRCTDSILSQLSSQEYKAVKMPMREVVAFNEVQMINFVKVYINNVYLYGKQSNYYIIIF